MATTFEAEIPSADLRIRYALAFEWNGRLAAAARINKFVAKTLSLTRELNP